MNTQSSHSSVSSASSAMANIAIVAANTVPVVRELAPRYPGLELVKNDLGPGVPNAVRAGIAAARAEVVVITMADLSDDVAVVPRLVELIRDEGYDVACPSRYVRGGRQVGGPRLKAWLSRAAGLSLHRLAGLPVHDATNSFRAYRRSFLTSVEVESDAGWEVTLELTVKAHCAGLRLTEVPCTWRHRTAGESAFRLLRWLPRYLRWYGHALHNRPRP